MPIAMVESVDNLLKSCSHDPHHGHLLLCESKIACECVPANHALYFKACPFFSLPLFFLSDVLQSATESIQNILYLVLHPVC